MYFKEEFRPICAEGFDNNDVGAKKICQALGLQHGVIDTRRRGRKYTTAIVVGECLPQQSLRNCSDSELSLTIAGCFAAEVRCSTTRITRVPRITRPPRTTRPPRGGGSNANEVQATDSDGGANANKAQGMGWGYCNCFVTDALSSCTRIRSCTH